MAQRLLNKVAVVTGAGDVLGRAVVERFLGEGAKVVVFGRDRGRLDELAAVAEARVVTFAGDVNSPDDLRGLAAATMRRFGAVDVLVPAPEGWARVPLEKPEESTAAFVSLASAVHLGAAQQTVRVFDKHLSRGASIVIVAAAAVVATSAGLAPFDAGQAALASLAKTLAVELSHRGIRVNGIAPVQFDSAPAAAGTDSPTPGRERGTRHAEQVADAVLFLASAEASGITGQELVVDASLA